MRKLMIFLTVVVHLSVPCISFANDADEYFNTDNFYDLFNAHILSHGYACKDVKVGGFHSKDERGTHLVIVCGDTAKGQIYYLLIRRDETICVEPYFKKGQKCK